MKTTLLFTFCLFTLISNTVLASNIGTKNPISSPTFPEKNEGNTEKKFSIGKNETPWKYNFHDLESIPMPENLKQTNKLATISSIDSSQATQAIFKLNDGKIIYFSQFKNVDGSYRVVIPQLFYNEMVALGYTFDGQEVKSVTDEEYKNEVKDVQLVVYIVAPSSSNKYLGGEGGRCAAGTIGGAIGGGIGGFAVGGPIGAGIGAIGGALAASAASCK